jgi:hypothetical protein
MTDPRIPESKQDEARLPDDLDQNPGIGQSKGLFAEHGSEDAQLIAGENTMEGDVENDVPVEAASGPDDLGRTND